MLRKLFIVSLTAFASAFVIKYKFIFIFIVAALRFKNLIDTNQIPVEKMGKSELDMQQYKKVFGTCRIPGDFIDTMEYHRNSQHIAVVVNGVFFKVPVYDQDGTVLGENQLQDQIRECIETASTQRDCVKIGVLTTDNRDNWAKAYREILKSDENQRNISKIQQALFVLAIDREMSVTEDDITTAENTLVTGAGSGYNSGNRWYDKTIQFVIGASGINGLTYEHSPAEGGPISVMSDFIIKNSKERDEGKAEPINRDSSFGKPQMLNFKSSPQLEEWIRIATNNIDKLAVEIDMGHLIFTDYGKNFIKAQKFSPDSYIQMAIQFAFYRLHQEVAAQYESAGTRLFVHGRTDVIRSCSKESVAFSKAMLRSKSDEEKVQKLRAAIESHKNYANAAVRGFGIDRHLLGLKLIAKENGLEVPALYSDDGYIKSSTYRLSTSQVASIYEAFMCYGPLTNDGYGCCYSPRNNDIYFGLSSMRSNDDTSTANFKKSLEEALMLMKELLMKAGEQPIKSKL